MLHPSIVPFETLQELCRPGEHPRRATVEAWAKAQGIPLKLDGKGGVWTTIEAVNYALGVAAANDDRAAYDSDII